VKILAVIGVILVVLAICCLLVAGLFALAWDRRGRPKKGE